MGSEVVIQSRLRVLAKRTSEEARHTKRTTFPVVLVVDDDPGVREGLTLVLQKRYQVCTASSGNDAVRMAD